MNLFVFLICGIAAFSCGFSLGLSRHSHDKKTVKEKTVGLPSRDMERMIREYRNFLEYDGSEQ